MHPGDPHCAGGWLQHRAKPLGSLCLLDFANIVRLTNSNALRLPYMKYKSLSVSRAFKALVLLSTLLAVGCSAGRDFVRDVPLANTNYAPQSDKALVVFMRPSILGGIQKSSVFDIVDGAPEFIGIIPYTAKAAHYIEPGERRFMVIGESADFMDATLAPGMVYYAIVRPRIGFAATRFSLTPVHMGDLRSEEFAEWYRKTPWVENLAVASEWAEKNMPSIREKMDTYLPRWLEKPNRPELDLADGVDTPYQLPN